MATVSVTGDLAGLSDKLLSGYGNSTVYLGYGRAISVHIGDFYYAGLSGDGAVIQQSGDTALSGSFDYAALTHFSGGFKTLLKIDGFRVDADSVFPLHHRDAGGVYVTYGQSALVRAVNAQSYEVTGSADDDTLAPGRLFLLRGNDRLDGLGGNDTLSGANGADTLLGGGGRDALSGGRGNDRLQGGAGNDRMSGDDGADRLDGGGGRDVLTGGRGADLFVFGARSGADTITDFQDGIDHLSVRGSYSLTQKAAGVLVDHGNGTVLLKGLTIDQIGADDFL